MTLQWHSGRRHLLSQSVARSRAKVEPIKMHPLHNQYLDGPFYPF